VVFTTKRTNSAKGDWFVAANWRLRHFSRIRGPVTLTEKMAANASSQLRRDWYIPLLGEWLVFHGTRTR